MTNIFEHDFFADYDWDHLTSGRGQPDTIKPPYLPPPHSDLKVGHSSLHTVIEEKNTQSLHPLYIFRCHALTTHPLNIQYHNKLLSHNIPIPPSLRFEGLSTASLHIVLPTYLRNFMYISTQFDVYIFKISSYLISFPSVYSSI